MTTLITHQLPIQDFVTTLRKFPETAFNDTAPLGSRPLPALTRAGLTHLFR